MSEWIVQLIISQSGHVARRAALACVLRLAQESWNIGNFNAVTEVLLGLRCVVQFSLVRSGWYFKADLRTCQYSRLLSNSKALLVSLLCEAKAIIAFH